MKLNPRRLMLNNVVSYELTLESDDELLEVIDDAADSFRRVIVGNGYYTTGPIVFRALPGSQEFTIMTTLGNKVNLVDDSDTGFRFQEHVHVATDYFYRHFDVEEPVPYAEIEAAVSEAGSRVESVYHVILDFYGEPVLDLYVEAEMQ